MGRPKKNIQFFSFYIDRNLRLHLENELKSIGCGSTMSGLINEIIRSHFEKTIFQPTIKKDGILVSAIKGAIK